MIADRWQTDEGPAGEEYAGFRIIEPQCYSCRKRFEGSLDSCDEYTSIPWDIATCEDDCDLYEVK